MSLSSPTVGLVSLGCPKALVDSERIITRLVAEGYAVSPTYAGAAVVIVNTCGFLDSARAESLEAIGEALAENGKVIVTGCLGADPEAIRQTHPKVLAITGPQQYEQVVRAVHAAVPPPHDPYISLVPPQGLHLTPRHYAYLKISEGCDNRCSFCLIPALRGDLVSRPAADILGEAERLARAGVKELLVISQDTSAYGRDLQHAPSTWRDHAVPARLTELATALGDLGVWIRLMYVYPYPWVDELLPLMADGRLLPYLDIPFQHASPSILKAMRRPAAQDRTLERLASWRAICPDLTVRSTFIVGFPGETEQDFQTLLDWLEAAQLDRVGCFRFEAVAGVPARDHANPVPAEVADDRWHRFMATQQAISARRLKAKVGRVLPVLIDSVDATGAVGRSSADAPEIDGQVLLPGAVGLAPGDVVRCKIRDSHDYDLIATPETPALRPTPRERLMSRRRRR